MIDFNSLIPLISGAAGGAVSAGVLNGPIKSLNDWWFFHFGYKTDYERKKAELLNKSKLDAYKQEIFDDVKSIPASNVQQPQLNIMGPALEASRYYIDSPELRSMFAKLVASSMDDRKKNVTRSTFVEFVKQMDPIDAKVLAYFSKNALTPIANIESVTQNDSHGDKYSHIEYSELLTHDAPVSDADRKFLPASVGNLARLNLISVKYNTTPFGYNSNDIFTDLSEYKNIHNNFQAAHKKYLESQRSIEQSSLQVSDEYKSNLSLALNQKLQIEHGIVTITSLGKEFVKICL